jgi:hypothetical protein
MMLTMIGFAVASARRTGAYSSKAAISATCTTIRRDSDDSARRDRAARGASGRSRTNAESAG